MRITNPTKNRIEVSIKGVKYAIEPEGILENIPEEHARYWQEDLHKFLILRKDKEVLPEPVLPPIVDIVEPVLGLEEKEEENLPEPEEKEEEKVEEVKVKKIILDKFITKKKK